jgi:tetratricopeptide (TPR) repeat protein
VRDGAVTAHKETRQAPRAPTADRPTAESGKARWAMPAGLVLLTIVAFLPVLRNGFVSWDDDRNFVENPHFRGLGLEQLRWMWTTFHMGHYVPLAWMTLGLDYEVWGMNPTGYHLTSLLLHAANTVVVYFLARALLELSRAAFSTEPRSWLDAAAGFAALVFALHPLRVESVAWATERRDVLSALFFFSSILTYLRSRGTTASRRGDWIALSLFLCALLSKATAMSLPAVLLILNVFPLRRLGGPAGWWSDKARRVYAEVAPFGLLAAATAGLSIVALHPPSQLGIAAKLSVSAYSLVFYLVKAVLPLGLAPLYEMPQHVDPSAARFVMSDVAVVCLAAIAWLLRRRQAGITAALAVFFVVTLPMLGVVQNGPQIAADRYTYFAAPALAVVVGAGLVLVLQRSFAFAAVGATAVVLALGALAWEQCEVWRDSETLWSRVLDVDGESSIAHSALSNVLYRENRVEEAMAHSRRAVAIAPNYPEALNGLAVGLAREGRLAEAIVEYQRALEIKPDYDDAETNWGVTLVQQRDVGGAIAHYQRALAINPDNSNAHVNWGNALVRLNRLDEAIGHYEAALMIRPDNAEAHHNWGVALALQGKFAAAIEQFRATLAIEPNHAEAREYLEKATKLLQESRAPSSPND